MHGRRRLEGLGAILPVDLVHGADQLQLAARTRCREEIALPGIDFEIEDISYEPQTLNNPGIICYTAEMNGRFSPPHLIAFIFLLALLLAIVQLGLVSWAFEKLGLSPAQGMLLLFSSLLGSVLNLPLTTIKAERPDLPAEFRSHRGLLRLPELPFNGRTVIAVNVGGCLVPLVFTLSLINRFPFSPGELLLSISVASVACYLGSRPIPGIGIGMAPLVAPLTAAIVALAIDRELAAPLAYISGTLGVIIGADLLRLKDVARLGAPVASIGGAGTFDGIFLTGMVAVLLT